MFTLFYLLFLIDYLRNRYLYGPLTEVTQVALKVLVYAMLLKQRE